MMSMPVGLDARLAERIVGTAMCRLRPTQGNKILCTKAELKQAILAAVDEAHDIGFLAGQKEQYAELTRPGSPDRPAWMDIRLDDPGDLDRNHIRFQPVVLRSLLAAGYRCLGDLRWVPSRELMNLHYVGFKWAGQIRAVVRRFERNPAPTPVATP
jgi:hypothetical protein